MGEKQSRAAPPSLPSVVGYGPTFGGKLDDVDRHILYELDRNSRQNISKLSHHLKVSRDRINYRIEKLVQQNIIRRFTLTLNPYKFGLIMYKVYLKVESNKPRINEFITRLRKHPRMFWVAECDGKWDIIFATFAHNPKEFRTLQQEILSDFNDLIISFLVYMLVDAVIFPRRYLTGATTAGVSLGGTPERSDLDAVDHKILKVLSNDSRLSAVQVAEQIDSSPSIVRRRLEDLEQRKIITAYRLELNLSALGMMFFKIQFDLGTGSYQVEEELKNYAISNPHVTYLIRQIGDRETEMELEVTSYEQLVQIMREIRQRCAGVVRDIEVNYIREHLYRV